VPSEWRNAIDEWRLAVEQALASALSDGCSTIGEIAIRTESGHFVLTHRDDVGRTGLEDFEQNPSAAFRLAMLDGAGNFRPLKTAPNLRRGWRMILADLARVASALDWFYPGRLALLYAWKKNRLKITPLRDTLNRQSGMYRVAATISDEQIDETVGNFCRSDGGCLRTILWRRDASGIVPSTKLPAEKFDPNTSRADVVPLLCQEACNLLVNECRKVVKGE
jgi:sirohydrochlorin cobaltochelatase